MGRIFVLPFFSAIKKCWTINFDNISVSERMLNRNVSEGYDDEVAEWLRRWTANPMGSARVGSNPILVVSFVQMLHFLSHIQKCFPLPGIEPGPAG